MPGKFILPLLLVVSVSAFGQSGTLSKKELINQIETASTKGTTTPPPKKQNVRAPDPSLATIATSGLDPHVMPATALSNDDLLIRGKTIFVVSNSFFVKKEQLERGLLNRKELGDWGIHVVNSPQQADLVLSVRRAPFQNNFPFTFTDRVSGIVVMGGTVNSLFGTVPGKIAGRLADRLTEVLKAQQPKKQEN